MRDFHIGDRVTFFGRAFFVRGFSPMSVTRRTIQLQDEQTGEDLVSSSGSSRCRSS